MTDAFDPKDTYVDLRPDNSAGLVPVTPDFWPTIETNTSLSQGRLVTSFHMDDHSHWERHPAGEELIYLASGRIDLVLDDGGTERTVELHPGKAFLMPTNMWHRFVIHEPGNVLVVTAGHGTEHRPL